MRLAMAQMSMVNDIEKNCAKTLQFMDLADEHKADLLFYPQLQMTPYFPQFRMGDVGGALNHVPDEFALSPSDKRIKQLCERCGEYGFYASPNFYTRENGRHFDTSLWITPEGKAVGASRAVHVTNVTNFCERDYFRPSKKGCPLYETPFGRIGVVIGFDRHFPETISGLAKRGADLVIIPAANIETEPLLMYEQELRVAAYFNGVFVAMCNRVGREGDIFFAGESIVIAPDGKVVVKADDSQQFLICSIDLSESVEAKKRRPYNDCR